MVIDAGEEFRIKATPSPELLRKLAYLAAQDNDSVLTGLRSPQTSYRSADSDRKRRGDALLQMARLSDPAYQQMSETINGKLDLLDEASVHALQEIEEELLDLRLRREKMLEQAYRDEQGRRIFMTEDESAAFYEDGASVADEEFAEHKNRLRGKPTWDKWQELRTREDDLLTERDRMHDVQEQGAELREDLRDGAISKEDAERRMQEIEETMPDRLRRNYEALDTKKANAGAAPDAEVSAEERAALDARSTSAQEAAAAPTAASHTPGAPSL